MSDPTFTLRHYHDDCASNNLSLADQISGMEWNSISALYSDLRSPSRSRRHYLRKRQLMLNPISRTKHCHRDCLSHSHRAISSRRRRRRRFEDDGDVQAYWDKECAELEHRERIEYSDLVTLYYNHGHNSKVIEGLRPKSHDCGGEEEDGDVSDWVEVSTNTYPSSQVSIISTPSWIIYLYPPYYKLADSELKSSDTGCCVWPETTFTYHLNLTGIWELGYANQHLIDVSADSLGCTQLPLALDCGCCSFNSGVHACHCADFLAWWRSPEEDWRGSIAEWMGGEVWDAMEYADAFQERMRDCEGVWNGAAVAADKTGGEDEEENRVESCEEWTFVRGPRAEKRDGEGWDIVSALSSTGSWRIIDVT